jgi:hypothetical protein
MTSKIHMTLGLLYMALLMLFPAHINAGGGTEAANTGTGSGTVNSSAGTGTTNWPNWVRDPYTKYDRQTYIAAVGSGSSREASEKSALGNLIAFFGQNIQVDERVSTSYQEAVRSGVTATWSENTAVDSVISTSTGLDSLVGAEIGDAWNDGREYFAVAVLNKATAIRIYTDIVSANQAMIENLINFPMADRNTLEGYARYQFAATVADMTISYANLLSVIGRPVQAVNTGDDYRLEALNIVKTIPVAIRVQNDRSGRIEGAFSKAFSDLGFQSGGDNSRYVLDVYIVTSVVEFLNSDYKDTRIEVAANLVEADPGTVLLPYNFNDRGRHTTQALADNQAYNLAEQAINKEYAGLLLGYLNQLLPKIQP